MTRERFTITLSGAQKEYIDSLVSDGKYTKAQIGHDALNLFIKKEKESELVHSLQLIANELVGSDLTTDKQELLINILNKLSEVSK